MAVSDKDRRCGGSRRPRSLPSVRLKVARGAVLFLFPFWRLFFGRASTSHEYCINLFLAQRLVGCFIVFLKKIRTRLDLLSIPLSGGKNVKTFYYASLCFIVLHCDVLLCFIVFYCVLLCFMVLHSLLLCFIVFHCFSLCFVVFHCVSCVSMYFIVFYCVLLCFIVFNCVYCVLFCFIVLNRSITNNNGWGKGGNSPLNLGKDGIKKKLPGTDLANPPVK